MKGTKGFLREFERGDRVEYQALEEWVCGKSGSWMIWYQATIIKVYKKTVRIRLSCIDSYHKQLYLNVPRNAVFYSSGSESC